MIPCQTLTLSSQNLLSMPLTYLSCLQTVLAFPLGHPVMKCLVVTTHFVTLQKSCHSCSYLCTHLSAWRRQRFSDYYQRESILSPHEGHVTRSLWLGEGTKANTSPDLSRSKIEHCIECRRVQGFVVCKQTWPTCAHHQTSASRERMPLQEDTACLGVSVNLVISAALLLLIVFWNPYDLSVS